MTTHFCSMYWNNVSPLLLSAQRRVFEKFNIPILQMERTGTHHGDWIDQIVSEGGENDDFLFVDIDCIPLNSEVVDEAVRKSKQGLVVGISQTANHLPNSDVIYAAPSFLAFSKRTWCEAGKPSFAEDQNFDVAGRFTAACREHGIELVLLKPYFVAFPKWPLGSEGCLGIGTFYEGGVFHLLQSRNGKYDDVFQYVAKSVSDDKKIDYLSVMKITFSSLILSRIVRLSSRRSPIREKIHKTLRRILYKVLNITPSFLESSKN